MIKNENAEQAVIGAILLDGTLFETLGLEPKHFYYEHHKRIYNSIIEVAKKKQDIDVVTVLSDYHNRTKNPDPKIASYLTDLASSVPSTETLRHYELLVLSAYRNRKSHEFATKYISNPNEESLDLLISNLKGLQDVGVKIEEKTTKDYLLKIIDEIMMGPTEKASGYKVGLMDLEKVTGGIKRSELNIIAARPSMGKTALTLSMASGHCSNGGSTHIFNLEMEPIPLFKRMISSVANINSQKWDSILFSSNDYGRAFDAIGRISEWNLYFYERAFTIDDIILNIRKAVRDNPEGDHLVMIDYLQLIGTSGRYERRDLEIGAITRRLKLLAKELKIPIILVSQLSRGVEQRQEKRPMMSDLRESGNIEQDADVIIFLYRDNYYDRESEKKGIIELDVSKNRNGPVGTVELVFKAEYGKFLNFYKEKQSAS